MVAVNGGSAMMKFITRDEVASLISCSVQHGQFFSLIFDRALPKCDSCGSKSKAWLASRPQTCPHCGGVVSYVREALAQTGVAHPQDKTIAPKGVGETFAQKRAKGLIGFYDPIAKGYRECRAENIRSVKCNGDEYVVVVTR